MEGIHITLRVGGSKLCSAFRLLKLACRENRKAIPPVLSTAFDLRDTAEKAFKHRRYHFARSVGLLPATKGSKLAGIRTVWLEKPEEAYPPLGYAIYESDEAWRIWKRYQDKTPYPDRRGDKTWKPFHKLDPNCLQYIVKADESVIFRSAKSGNIIGMVIRNFSNNNKLLLEWLNEIIAENTDERRSVRVGPAPKLHLSWLTQCLFSWRTLGSCARSAILLVRAAAPSWGGRGICLESSKAKPSAGWHTSPVQPSHCSGISSGINCLKKSLRTLMHGSRGPRW